MKLRKQIKNRIVAVAMLAVVLFGSLSFAKPETAYADGTLDLPEYDFRYNDFTNEENFDLFKWDSSCIGDTVSFWNAEKQSFSTAIISTSPLKASYIEYEYRGKYGGGSELRSERVYTTHSGHFEASGKTYYYVWYGMTTAGGHIGYQVKKGICFGSKDFDADNAEKYIQKYILKKLPTSFVVIGGVGVDTNKIPDGSRENPIEDSNIGTLLLDRSKCYWTEGGEQPTVQRISWKNKTDTGFSLNNNKYALTRIEVKIGNRVTYFGDVEHHGTGKEVDNFGKVYPFKYVNPKSNPYDFSFTEMLTASQTDLEKYNPAMLEHEYDLYFRVICSDAIGTSAKYYVGKWTRYRCTDDPKQKGDNESDDGHFNENGEWEKDKDTDVDSGGIGNVKDEDEKNDDFNNFTDSENWKDWLNEGGLDLDSAKAFISQIAEVPKMIGDIFSFLPKWVLYSFALGFGLIPVVIVIKFLRG